MTDGSTPCDLLVFGASCVVTHADGVAGTALVIKDGKVLAVGEPADLRRDWTPAEECDVAGKLVVPGFVDAHTHPVFATGRAEEFDWRAEGLEYLEIARRGGGIHSSVRAVRDCAEDALTEKVAGHFSRMQALGTVACEAKSGYGLSLDAEMKSLRVIQKAAEQTGMEVFPTFLGAHMIPEDFKTKPDAYVDLLCEEMLPAVKEAGLALAADVFIEEGAFNLQQARRYLVAAKDLGFALRIHADQFNELGGVSLAVELEAQSVDHLESLSDKGLEALAMGGGHTFAGLLPAVPHFLRQSMDAPARKLLDAGVPYFIATDFNPGSCYTASLSEAAHFGRVRLRLTAEEVLWGVTAGAADSLQVGNRLGRLAPGYDAKWLALDLPDVHHFGYGFGESPVD